MKYSAFIHLSSYSKFWSKKNIFKNLNKKWMNNKPLSKLWEMFCAGRCVPALVWERQKSASRQGPRVRLGGAMLDNFLNIVSLVRTFIVNLYVCVIYRRASHAGPWAPLCFARINRHAPRHSKPKTEPKHKRSTKEVPPWNGQWNILLEGLNRFNGANLTLNSDVDQDT